MVGMTVVLSDGTIAKSGGKVIKNVAGYDLAKLFAGSFGTLGLIASVAVRLHPAPAAHRHADRRERRPGRGSRRAAVALAALPLEADCLDVGWEGDARLAAACASAARRRPSSAEAARERVDARRRRRSSEDDDASIWALQRGLPARGGRHRGQGLRPPDRPAGA